MLESDDSNIESSTELPEQRDYTAPSLGNQFLAAAVTSWAAPIAQSYLSQSLNDKHASPVTEFLEYLREPDLSTLKQRAEYLQNPEEFEKLRQQDIPINLISDSKTMDELKLRYAIHEMESRANEVLLNPENGLKEYVTQFGGYLYGDPTNIIPVGQLYGLSLKASKGLAIGLAKGAGSTALAVGLSEAALVQPVLENKSLEESATEVVYGGILGGILGTSAAGLGIRSMNKYMKTIEASFDPNIRKQMVDDGINVQEDVESLLKNPEDQSISAAISQKYIEKGYGQIAELPSHIAKNIGGRSVWSSPVVFGLTARSDTVKGISTSLFDHTIKTDMEVKADHTRSVALEQINNRDIFLDQQEFIEPLQDIVYKGNDVNIDSTTAKVVGDIKQVTGQHKVSAVEVNELVQKVIDDIVPLSDVPENMQKSIKDWHVKYSKALKDAYKEAHELGLIEVDSPRLREDGLVTDIHRDYDPVKIKANEPRFKALLKEGLIRILREDGYVLNKNNEFEQLNAPKLSDLETTTVKEGIQQSRKSIEDSEKQLLQINKDTEALLSNQRKAFKQKLDSELSPVTEKINKLEEKLKKFTKQKTRKKKARETSKLQKDKLLQEIRTQKNKLKTIKQKHKVSEEINIKKFKENRKSIEAKKISKLNKKKTEQLNNIKELESKLRPPKVKNIKSDNDLDIEVEKVYTRILEGKNLNDVDVFDKNPLTGYFKPTEVVKGLTNTKKSRQIPLSNRELQDFIKMDVINNGVRHLQKLKKQINLAKWVKQQGFDTIDEMRFKIKDDYLESINDLEIEVKNEKNLVKRKLKQRELESMQQEMIDVLGSSDKLGWFDSSIRVVLGEYKLGTGSRKTDRFVDSWLFYQVLNKLGRVTLSSIPDAARVMIAHPAGNFISKGIISAMATLMQNKALKNNKAVMKQFGASIDMTMNTMYKLMMQGTDHTSPITKTDIGKDLIARFFLNATGMRQWNGFWRGVSAHMSIDSILTAGQRLGKGEALKKWELERFRVIGLSNDDLKGLYREWKRSPTNGAYGSVKTVGEGGLSEEAMEKLVYAVQKEIDSTIIIPGAGDRPFWATKSAWGQIINQFQTFNQAATTKYLIPALQDIYRVKSLKQGEMYQALMRLQWMFGAIGMSMLSLELKSRISTGDGIDWNPEKAIGLGIAGSGILGYMMQNIMNLYGSINGNMADRYGDRNLIQQLGPTAGFMSDLYSNAAKYYNGKNIPREELWRTQAFRNLDLIRQPLDMVFDTMGVLPTRDSPDFKEKQRKYLKEQRNARRVEEAHREASLYNPFDNMFDED